MKTGSIKFQFLQYPFLRPYFKCPEHTFLDATKCRKIAFFDFLQFVDFFYDFPNKFTLKIFLIFCGAI